MTKSQYRILQLSGLTESEINEISWQGVKKGFSNFGSQIGKAFSYPQNANQISATNEVVKTLSSSVQGLSELLYDENTSAQIMSKLDKQDLVMINNIITVFSRIPSPNTGGVKTQTTNTQMA